MSRYTHMYIYIYICIYIYIYSKYSTDENTIFLQKDAHRFTDFVASPEMSVRFCFVGETIDILFAAY